MCPLSTPLAPPLWAVSLELPLKKEFEHALFASNFLCAKRLKNLQGNTSFNFRREKNPKIYNACGY